MLLINPQSCIFLLSIVCAIALARPSPQDIVVVTVTMERYQPPVTTEPPASVNSQPKPNNPAKTISAAIEGPQQPSTKGSSASVSSKRGLAYNSSSPALDMFTSHPKITWGHDWSSVDFHMPSQIEFVATLTDLSPDVLPYWEANVKTALGRGSPDIKYLMSFNEPDQPGSKALMDVGSAVAAYQQHMNHHASSTVKLGSPSVTNGIVNGMGLAFLSSFLEACNPCTVDFVPVHWYGCDNGCPVDQDVKMFIDQMTQAMEAAKGKPVWIPEFGRIGSIEEQQAFLEKVLPWLDDPAQAQIERYSYFMVWDGFLTTGGALNPLGVTYVS